MKNKTLLGIFLVLLIVFLTSQFAFERKTRSFKTELIQLDTTKITSLLLYPKSDNQEEILIKKEGDFWAVSKGNITTKANQGAVASILRNLSLIKTKRVASKNKEKWKDYEVEETSGSRIKAFQGEKLLEDFIVGRFNFNQQTRQGISYVRLTKGDEVYAVDGFLSMTMGQGFDAYRNKQIISLTDNQVNQISINTEGNTTILQKNGTIWTQDGNPVDSATISNYLTGLQSVSGGTFVDDFEETQSQILLYKTLAIEGDELPEPIIVKAYRDTTRETPFIIQSSINKDGFFSSAENGIYDKIFSGW